MGGRESSSVHAATLQDITDWAQFWCPDCKHQSCLGREDRVIIHSHGPVTCATKTDLLPSLRLLNDSADCCFVFLFFFLFVLACKRNLQHDPHFQASVFTTLIMSWATTQTHTRRYKPPVIPNFPFWPRPRSRISVKKIVLLDETLMFPSCVFHPFSSDYAGMACSFRNSRPCGS